MRGAGLRPGGCKDIHGLLCPLQIQEGEATKIHSCNELVRVKSLETPWPYTHRIQQLPGRSCRLWCSLGEWPSPLPWCCGSSGRPPPPSDRLGNAAEGPTPSLRPDNYSLPSVWRGGSNVGERRGGQNMIGISRINRSIYLCNVLIFINKTKWNSFRY